MEGEERGVNAKIAPDEVKRARKTLCKTIAKRREAGTTQSELNCPAPEEGRVFKDWGELVAKYERMLVGDGVCVCGGGS